MVTLSTIGFPMLYGQLFTSHIRNPVLNQVMVFTAVDLVYLIPLALLYLWFVPETNRTSAQRGTKRSLRRFMTERGKQKSVFIFVTVVASLAISYTMGKLYSHPAPYMAGYNTLLSGVPENSFPSQHTTVVFAFAWSLLYLQDRYRVGLVALVFATLVGISRVYVGVHYPVDILGGIVASILGFAVVYAGRNLVTEFANGCVYVEDRLLTALF